MAEPEVLSKMNLLKQSDSERGKVDTAAIKTNVGGRNSQILVMFVVVDKR